MERTNINESGSIAEPKIKIKIKINVPLDDNAPKMLNTIGQMFIRYGQALIVANDSGESLQENVDENERCLPFY